MDRFLQLTKQRLSVYLLLSPKHNNSPVHTCVSGISNLVFVIVSNRNMYLQPIFMETVIELPQDMMFSSVPYRPGPSVLTGNSVRFIEFSRNSANKTLQPKLYRFSSKPVIRLTVNSVWCLVLTDIYDQT
jgi:hypothetical protein